MLPWQVRGLWLDSHCNHIFLFFFLFTRYIYINNDRLQDKKSIKKDETVGGDQVHRNSIFFTSIFVNWAVQLFKNNAVDREVCAS